jgi:DNA helicase-2/ATP-dependent DNA helicase PcrA
LLLSSPEAGTADAIRAITGFPSPPAARDHWSAFTETIRLMHGKSMGSPDELELVCQSYASHLERIYDDAMMRQADLVQLAQIASGYPNREQFLTELALDPPNATNDEAGGMRTT